MMVEYALPDRDTGWNRYVTLYVSDTDEGDYQVITVYAWGWPVMVIVNNRAEGDSVDWQWINPPVARLTKAKLTRYREVIANFLYETAMIALYADALMYDFTASLGDKHETYRFDDLTSWIDDHAPQVFADRVARYVNTHWDDDEEEKNP